MNLNLNDPIDSVDSVDPVIIVGAGLSGLRAASLLTAQGIKCNVLEARGRIGGRVLSEEVPGKPELGRFDLGPTWFWPQYERTITKLVKELGLGALEQYNEGSMLSERSLNEPIQQYKLPEDAIERSLRFIGGVQSLIDAIASTLPNGIVQLHTRVTSIRQEDDGTITVKTDSSKESIRASAIIMTLPPRIVARKIHFSPALSPRLMDSLLSKPTWMGGQAKAIAVYDRPFWREQGFSGLVTSWAGPLQEIHDASPATGAGALFGFFGMPPGMRQELGEEQVQKLVIEQLTRLFGPSAENMIALLYKDWSIDPETSVAEDAARLREFPSYGYPVGLENWGKKMIFAGTETAVEQGGHLEGALQSAERAASEVIAWFTKL